ncbi:hypothetical protein GCM10009753_79220 [Streptantibioticus ferralitis]
MQAGDRPGSPLYAACVGRIRLAAIEMGVIRLEPESGTAGAQDLAETTRLALMAVRPIGIGTHRGPGPDRSVQPQGTLAAHHHPLR